MMANPPRCSARHSRHLGFAALVAVACGPAHRSMTLEQVGAGHGSAYCAHLSTCCTPAEIDARYPTATRPVTDEPSCASYVGQH